MGVEVGLRRERENRGGVQCSGIMNIYIWRLDICTIHLFFMLVAHAIQYSMDSAFESFFFFSLLCVQRDGERRGGWRGEFAACLYVSFGGGKGRKADQREGGCILRSDVEVN